MDETKKRQIIAIIDDVDDMTIATVRDDGYPQATTVSYVNDGLTIYLGTTAESQKARNIARNSKVSLTINRGHANWGEIEGLSVGGVATLVSDPNELDKVSELLFKKFPQIAEFVPPDTDEEDLALYRIDAEVISLLDYRKGFGHTEQVEI